MIYIYFAGLVAVTIYFLRKRFKKDEERYKELMGGALNNDYKGVLGVPVKREVITPKMMQQMKELEKVRASQGYTPNKQKKRSNTVHPAQNYQPSDGIDIMSDILAYELISEAMATSDPVITVDQPSGFDGFGGGESGGGGASSDWSSPSDSYSCDSGSSFDSGSYDSGSSFDSGGGCDSGGW